jgi:hypothetical protein
LGLWTIWPTPFTLDWLESDEIGIISGLVHVEFKSLFQYYKTFMVWISTHQKYSNNYIEKPE